MRTKFAIIVCLVFFSSVSAQESIFPADYYPLAVGVEWEYEGDGSTTTETVIGVEEGLFVLEDQDGVRTYWSSDTDGLRVHKFYVPDQDPDLEWSYLDPPITRFPYEMELGVEYESRSLLKFAGLWDVETYITYKSTFEGFEDHIVGDRTYPLCARITTRDASRSVFLEQTILTTTSESTEWLAWDIGAVEKQSHIVMWDILYGESEEWVNAKLTRCSLLEDNPPSLDFANPTSESVYVTDAPSISISGSASDDSRVMKVTWEDDHGNGGLALLDGDWQVADTGLEWGKNVITISAWDPCGNVSTKDLTVYRMSVSEPSPHLCHEGELLEAIQLTGSGLTEDLIVELIHEEKAIAATNVRVTEGGTVLEFDMDLHNSGAGSWDLVIKDPSQFELVRLADRVETVPLRVIEIRRTTGPGITLRWTSLAGRSYEVWSAPSVDGQWEFAASVPSQGENTSWEESLTESTSREFYRIAPVPIQK